MAYARRNDHFGGGNKFGRAPHGRSFSDRGGAKPLMYPATCGDCGNRCEVPFRPNGKKPVLCKSCFAQGNKFDGDRSMGNDDTAAQLRSIHAKLDAILKALNANGLSL